ncbi:hypothetical protein CR513_45073, partial [Mucuna pruriens]
MTLKEMRCKRFSMPQQWGVYVCSSLYSSQHCFCGGSFGEPKHTCQLSGSLKVLRSSGTLTPILLDVNIANTPRLDTSTCWLEELSLGNSYSPFDHNCRVCGLFRGIQPWDMTAKLFH